jgi:uncharacterized membrane protein
MTQARQWNTVERRDGLDRRGIDLPWQDERRTGERRRGGLGTRHPNPTEALLRGINAPTMLAFEPRWPVDGETSAHSVLETLAPKHERHDAIPSTAAIAGHPLHPVVVPLPIGALTGALAADIAYAATDDPFFARAGRLLTLTGLVTGAFAAVLGGVDFWSKGQIRSHRIAWFHVLGNALMLALSGISLGLRMRGGRAATLPAGLALSAASAVVLMVTGWLGGELSYRHRIGLTRREEGSR